MKIPNTLAEKAISAAVGLLGIYVLIGWAIGSEEMVRVLPNSVATCFNTALLLVASSASLSQALRESKFAWLSRFATYLLIVLPGLILFEYLTNINLGIDWISLHTSVKDGNPVPGRPAPNACVGFIFAGFALFGFSRDRLSKLQGRLVVFFTYGTLAIGISAMIGHALNLEFMYRYAAYNRMALPAATGLSLLGVGLWLAFRQRRASDGRLPVSADIHITKTAIVVLTVVTLVTGLTGFFVMKYGFEESMSTTLLRSAKSYAGTFESAIDQQLILDDIIAARPGIQNGLLELEKNPKDAKTIALLGEIGKSFIPFGLTGYELFDIKGNKLVSIGSMIDDSAAMTLPLSRPSQQAQLLWQDGFVLRNSKPILREGRQVGSFIAEQRMSMLTATMREMVAESASTDVLVCGRAQSDALCFPSKFYQANLRIPMYKDGQPHLAISRALLNQKGVMTVPDLRGISVLAGYAPIGTLGLGLVLKTDSVELYLPVRQRLNLFVGMLIFLVAMGTFMLRAQVQPLARRLLNEQKRTKIILDSSHEAYIEIDSNGIIVDWNAEAERTFGWSMQEAIGSVLADLIMPKEFREKHAEDIRIFLKNGMGPVIGKRMELPALHRSGKEFMVETTISVIEDNGEYTFTAFMHDISERKAAELKLLASESRLTQLARFDLLTGLPNRFQLTERLDEATNRRRRVGAPLAIMFLDIDHFKQINDTLGHAAGDTVLKEFATRLKDCLRTTDTAGRYAGDEFVVFMEAPNGIDEPTIVAQKIIDAMQRSWQVEGKSLQITTSMGIAYACEEMLSPDELLAKADGALYKAKSDGRNCFVIVSC